MYLSRFMKKTILIITAFFLIGCGAGLTHTLVPDYGERGVASIAVMPVTSITNDEAAASIFRTSLIENLYFRGYGKLAPDAVDGKTSGYIRDHALPNVSDIRPEVLGSLLGVDALMYCRFDNLPGSTGYLYAPVTVSTSFELVSTKTGETLWTSRCSVTERAFGITPKRLEMKACQSYGMAVEEIMEKSLATLPAGPRYVQAPGSDGSAEKLW
jgi:hypothetical protein